ncbi:MAG: hypothetical protein ACRDP9_10835 [Kribbellaceae bacterium]|nr:hypothetical protein [Kribbellaceae bacterium]
MTLLIIIALVVAAIAAWKFRVQILSKVLGQPEQRIQRAIDKRKGR